MKRIKFYLRITWIVLILTGLILFFLYPNWFTKDSLSNFIKTQSSHILLIYVILSLVRGFFLLPSTPFVLAGIILFPTLPFLVFTISISSILVTATYLYFGSKFLEFDKLFNSKHSNKKNSISNQLNKYGFWIVLGWSFFPFVPTDLICYIAGSIRMNFFRFISGILLGEAILVGGYIYMGESIWNSI